MYIFLNVQLWGDISKYSLEIPMLVDIVEMLPDTH